MARFIGVLMCWLILRTFPCSTLRFLARKFTLNFQYSFSWDLIFFFLTFGILDSVNSSYMASCSCVACVPAPLEHQVIHILRLAYRLITPLSSGAPAIQEVGGIISPAGETCAAGRQNGGVQREGGRKSCWFPQLGKVVHFAAAHYVCLLANIFCCNPGCNLTWYNKYIAKWSAMLVVLIISMLVLAVGGPP